MTTQRVLANSSSTKQIYRTLVYYAAVQNCFFLGVIAKCQATKTMCEQSVPHMHIYSPRLQPQLGQSSQ